MERVVKLFQTFSHKLGINTIKVSISNNILTQICPNVLKKVHFYSKIISRS